MSSFTPVNISYKEFNPANGADGNLSPIIFLHGMTGSKEVWDDIPQIIADKTKRKAYAIDARNHGDSDYTETFTFDVNVDDLLHFMDTKNIKKAVLVGHSMGGLTASNTALRQPDRVEKIFSEDMFVKKVPQEIFGPIIGFFQAWVQIVQNIPPHLEKPEALKFALDILISKIPKEFESMISKEHIHKFKIDLKRNPDGKYDVKFNKDAIFRGIQNAETLMKDPCGQYNGPAYFIYGSVSPMHVGKEEEHIKKHFPKAELIEFKDATHNVHGEYPEKFIDTIVQRLQ